MKAFLLRRLPSLVTVASGNFDQKVQTGHWAAGMQAMCSAVERRLLKGAASMMSTDDGRLSRLSHRFY